MIYLDNSATTKCYDAVIAKVTKMMTDTFGNPSSLHSVGFDAEKELKEARKILTSVFPSGGEVVFTSGGTESDNMAIVGAFNSKKRESNHIITTTIEHPALLETVRKLEKEGARVSYIEVDKNSRLDLYGLREAMESGDNKGGAAVVSIMSVNNETGAMMPLCHVRDIIEEAEKKGGVKPIFHTDSVQALGKEEVKTIPADLISVSAHKIHGPKGVGALYIKNGIRIQELITGGGQEKGLRSGTENMPGISGFAEAVKVMSEDRELSGRIREIHNLLKQGIVDEIPDIRINSPEDGTPAILNISFLGTRGEVILHALEQEGIMVSTGSACASGKNAHKSGSHVLKAMGLPKEVIEGAIRFSIGALNTPDEVPYVLDKLKSAVGRFRKLGSFR